MNGDVFSRMTYVIDDTKTKCWLKYYSSGYSVYSDYNSGIDWYVLGERSSTGLLEWDSKGDAMEALIVANHQLLPNPSKLFESEAILNVKFVSWSGFCRD